MPINISPHFTDNKLDNPSVDDLVDVFEDRIKYWVLGPAKSLLNADFGHFAALCLMLTYFEGIWIYIEGRDSKDHSKQFFREGFIDVFRRSGISDRLLGQTANILYEDARCGFFHDGMSRARIYLCDWQEAALQITLPKKNGQIDEGGQIQSICVNPGRFYFSIEDHLNTFLTTLRKPEEIASRNKFQEICRTKWDWETEGPLMGIDDPTIPAT